MGKSEFDEEIEIVTRVLELEDCCGIQPSQVSSTLHLLQWCSKGELDLVAITDLNREWLLLPVGRFLCFFQCFQSGGVSWIRV